MPLSCARTFSQLLLDERGDTATRDVLKLTSVSFASRKNTDARDSQPSETSILWTPYSMMSNYPKKFRTVRLPQMRERIPVLGEARHEGRDGN